MPRKPKEACKTRTAACVLAEDPRNLTDALTRTWSWWEDQDLLEDLDIEAFRERARALTVACADLHVTTVGDLFQRAKDPIATAAGVNSLNMNSGIERGQRAHATRNLVTALLWTLTWLDGRNPCPVVDEMPAIAPRPGAKTRRAHDDEILLLRLRAVYRMHRTPRFVPAGILYALTEAGVWPSEATHAVISDFDDPARPTRFRVRPQACRADTDARDIHLPLWAQRSLASALKPNSDPGHRCVFQGIAENENNSASITATQSLTRAMADVGVDDSLEPTELVFWRAEQTRRAHGSKAAARSIGWTHKDAVANVDARLHRYAPKSARQALTFEGN